MKTARLPVLSRIAAAALGGYALATLLSSALAGVLPEPKAEAVLAATMISFAIYAGTILWAFAAPSAGRAWLGLLLPTALCGAFVWLAR